jgi:hypothetical protein
VNGGVNPGLLRPRSSAILRREKAALDRKKKRGDFSMRSLRICVQGVTAVFLLMLAAAVSRSQQNPMTANLGPMQTLAALHLAPRASLLALPQNPIMTGLPSSDEILAKYEKFMGGKEALAKVMTRIVWSRRIQDPGAPAETILLRYSKRPNFSIMRHNNLDGTLNHWENGCDGTAGWMGAGGKGGELHDMGPNRSAGPICHQELYYYGYFALDLEAMKASYKQLEVKSELKIVQPPVSAYGALAGGIGKDLVGTGPRDAYLVLAVAAREGDDGAWLIFDKETGALLRRQHDDDQMPGPPSQNTRFTSFLQYREVGDGTVAPFQFETQASNAIVRGVHTKIEDNTPVDDKVFARPKSALKEKE